MPTDDQELDWSLPAWSWKPFEKLKKSAEMGQAASRIVCVSIHANKSSVSQPRLGKAHEKVAGVA